MAINANLEIERAATAVRRTPKIRQSLSTFHHLASLDENSAHSGVDALDAETVRDAHEVPLLGIVPDFGHAPRAGSGHRLLRPAGFDVQSRMGNGGLGPAF